MQVYIWTVTLITRDVDGHLSIRRDKSEVSGFEYDIQPPIDSE